jgi:hypothetical protein
MELEERIRIRALFSVKDSPEENDKILGIQTRYIIFNVVKQKIYLNE